MKKNDVPKTQSSLTKTEVTIPMEKLRESINGLAVLRQIKTEKVFDEKKNFKESVISLTHKLAIGRATEEAWNELVKFDRMVAELKMECSESVSKGTKEEPKLVQEIVSGSEGEKRFQKEIKEALADNVVFSVVKIPFSTFSTMGFDADLDTAMLMQLEFMIDFEN